MSNVCQYLTLYRLLVLCQYVQCCLLKAVHYLSVTHIVPSVGFVSICLLSKVCQDFTLYRLLVLCQYVQCCFLQSVRCVSVPHTVPSVGSVSLCPLLSSTVCPKLVRTSHCTLFWTCVTTTNAIF